MSPGLAPIKADPEKLTLPAFLSGLEHYDVPHYLSIAQHGYAPGAPEGAFHPLYPLLMRTVSLTLFRDVSSYHVVLSGMMLSAVCSMVVLALLHRLCSEHLRLEGRGLCLTLWALNPTAVFLLLPYTESLFIGLTMAAFLQMQRRQWGLAGLFTGLACATRPVGLLVYLSLLAQWYISRRTLGGPTERGDSHAIGVVTPLLFITAWVAYQAWCLHDPLASVHAEQRYWGQGFALPWQFVGHLASSLAWSPRARPDYILQVALHIALLVVSVLLVDRMCHQRKLPVGMRVYVVLTLLGIVLRSSDMSISRFLMAAFPLHMTLADWLVEGPASRALAVILGSLVVNVLGTVAFVTGRAFF